MTDFVIVKAMFDGDGVVMVTGHMAQTDQCGSSMVPTYNTLTEQLVDSYYYAGKKTNSKVFQTNRETGRKGRQQSLI